MSELDNISIGDEYIAFNDLKYIMNRTTKDNMEQFEKATGKNAFWRGKETGTYVDWHNKQNIKILKVGIAELTKENNKLKEERIDFKEKLTQFLLSIKLFIE